MEETQIKREAKLLHKTLGKLRFRGVAFVVGGGILWVLTAAVIGLWALSFSLGWWGGEFVLVGGWVFSLALVLTSASFLLLWPLVAVLEPHSVAVRIGAVRPMLASRVLSASELSVAEAHRDFSKELVVRHFRAVHQKVLAIPRREVFPRRLLAGPLVAFALVSTLAGLSYVAMPGVFMAGIRILLEDARPAQQDATIRTLNAPVVGDLTLTMRYPEYLERPERRLEATSGCLVAPLGTTVLVEGRSLVPGARSGSIHLPQNMSSPLTVSATGRVTGSFVLLAPGPFSFSLSDGEVTVQGMECELEVEPDPAPTIRLLRPTEEQKIDADQTLVFEFEAEDDHGLEFIDVVIHAGSGREYRKTILRLASDVRHIRTSYEWSPSSLRLPDSEYVEVELEAYDDDMIMGPKPGRTLPVPVRIMTPMSRHQSVLAEQGEALDGLVDLLGARLQSPVPPDRRPAVARERMIALQRETEDVLGVLARLIHSLSLDTISSRRVIDTFAQVRESIANQLLYERRMYEGELERFKERRGVDRATVRIVEQAILRADDLIVEQKLGRLVRTGSELESARAELIEAIRAYARSGKEAARRSVLDMIEQMLSGLRKLEREAETVRGRSSDAYVNIAALMQVDVQGGLQRIREMLARDDIEGALALAGKIENDIQRLMAGLEGTLLAFRTEHFGEGEEFVAAMTEKVMAVESEQIQLQRETVALQRRYRERLLVVMQKKIDNLVESQLERTALMADQLDLVDALKFDRAARQSLARLKVAVREIDMALRQGDLEETMDVAGKVARIVDDLGLQLDGPLPDALAEAKNLAKLLNDTVRESFPKPTQVLSQPDRRRTRGMAARQRAVRGMARRLRFWIREEEDKAQFVSQRALGVLTKVIRKMDRSVSRLEEKAIRDSLGFQSQALDDLAQLREDLKRGNESMNLDQRPVVVRGLVEIPEPEDFQVPAEFRNDILEAMESRLPERYQSAIKRYYETLVR